MTGTAAWITAAVIAAIMLDAVFILSLRRRGLTLLQFLNLLRRLIVSLFTRAWTAVLRIPQFVSLLRPSIISLSNTVWAAILGMPRGIALLLLCLTAFFAQYIFGNTKTGHSAGVVLVIALFPLAGFYVYRESRETARTDDQDDIDLSPRPVAWSARATNMPWRTLMFVLAFVSLYACIGYAREKDTYLAAFGLWLASVVFFIAACWLFPTVITRHQIRQTLRQHWMEIVLAGAVLIAGSFIRLYALERFPPGMEQDEGFFGRDALFILEGKLPHFFSTAWFFDHPAVFSFLQAWTMSVIGKDAIGLRTLSGILGSIDLLFVYLLARQLFGKSIAIVSAALYASAPYQLIFSRTGVNHIVIPLFFTATVYFLCRAITTRRAIDYSLAGVCFGLGLWLDYNNKVMALIPLMGATLAYLLIVRHRYWRYEFPVLGVFLAGLIVTLSPVWSTYYYTNQLWQDATRGRFVLSREYIQGAESLYHTTNPLIVMANQTERVLFGLNYFGDASHNAAIGRRPMLDSLTAVLFFLGLALSVWRVKEVRYAILLIYWMIGLQANIWSNGPPQAHRMLLFAAPTYLLAAIGIERVTRAAGGILSWPGRRYQAVAVGLVLGIVTYTNLNLVFSPGNYPPAWLETAEAGKAIRNWTKTTMFTISERRGAMQTATVQYCSLRN